jgi:hypothetical protein
MKRFVLILFFVAGFVVFVNAQESVNLESLPVCKNGQCQVRRSLFSGRRLERTVTRNGDVAVQIELGSGKVLERLETKREQLRVKVAQRKGFLNRILSRVFRGKQN